MVYIVSYKRFYNHVNWIKFTKLDNKIEAKVWTVPISRDIEVYLINYKLASMSHPSMIFIFPSTVDVLLHLTLVMPDVAYRNIDSV